MRTNSYHSNLEAIFRSIKDGIITVDREWRVIELNDAAKKLCKYPQDTIGKDFRTLFKNCGRKCIDSASKAIEQKRPVQSNRLECQCGHRQGGVVTLTTSPLLDKQNGFAGAVLVIRNETAPASLERAVKERHPSHNIIGKRENVQKLYSLIEDLADVQTTVLITGESGTGKELVAEALHDSGVRGNKPLVKVNCAALAENLLESELFGHVKGAFTGAIRDKIGRFQRADGGTILLDEIGDISARMQLRLLRVLEEMEFERVGESTPIKIDARVIAATNQNLYEKVRNGEFREDLYYRLKVVELALAPLRERRDDIPLLVTHFLQMFNRKLNKSIGGVSDEVQKIFMAYSWPGNIRELEHTLEHAFILCHQNTIDVNHLPRNFNGSSEKNSLVGDEKHTDQRQALRQTIIDALEKTVWNKSRAARLLGISRRTIYRKMTQYNIVKKPFDN